MTQPKVDATASANALDTQLDIQPQNGLVEISQRSDRFALHPQKVKVPFNAILILAAQIILMAQGVQPVDVSGAGGNESRPH